MKYWFNLFLLFLVFCHQIYSFTPGKWSHTDRYVLGISKNGPLKEVVKNPKGEIIFTAEYEYNKDGFLFKEKYTDNKGQANGETIYVYENGKLVREELYSSNIELQEKKMLQYSPKGILNQIILYSKDGTEVLKCKIDSMKNEYVVRGETTYSEGNEMEILYYKKDPKESNVYFQEIMNTQRKMIGFIKYIFDDKENLISREFSQGNNNRKQIIQYDSQSRVENFSFYSQKDGNWMILKTHYLEYK